MGVRGPIPKPNGIKEREGNPGRRPFNKEPQFPVGIPDRPKKMSRGAVAVWDEIITAMASANILRTVDQRALWQLAEDEALLAEAYSGIWKSVKALQREAKAKGQALPGGALFALLGMRSSRMAINSISHIAARVIIQRREFGLTPSARTRFDVGDVGLPGQNSSLLDPLEAALCGDVPRAPVN